MHSWKWQICDLQTQNTESEVSYLWVRFKKCLLSHSKRKSIRRLLCFLGELEIAFIREIHFPPTPRGLQIPIVLKYCMSRNGFPKGELLSSDNIQILFKGFNLLKLIWNFHLLKNSSLSTKQLLLKCHLCTVSSIIQMLFWTFNKSMIFLFWAPVETELVILKKLTVCAF